MITHPDGRRRRSLTALVLLALAAGLLVVAPSAPASAATTGSVTWGVAASLRSAVAGSGTITTAGGATQAASNGVFTLPQASAWRDGARMRITAGGTIRFATTDGSLDVAISDVQVGANAPSGSISLDAEVRTPGADPVVYDDVDFASVDLSATTVATTTTTASFSAAPVRITADGAALFGGRLPAGTALDPVSVELVHGPPASCVPPAPTVRQSDARTGILYLTLSRGSCPADQSWRIFLYAAGSSTPIGTDDADAGITGAYASGLRTDRVYRVRVALRSVGGVGPQSAYSTWVAPPIEGPLDQFVEWQYRSFRGRKATAAERAPFVAALENGTLSPPAMISQAVDFPEVGVQAPVVRLFQAYFLRVPDTNGLRYWVDKSRTGTRITTISSSFAGSNEFKARYGSLSNRAFVALVYQNVLGRPGDSGGIAYWTAQLDRRLKSRGEVMVGFSESNEFKTKTKPFTDVVAIYTGMVRRAPTTDEVNGWTTAIRGGAPRTDVIAALLKDSMYDIITNGVLQLS